MALSCCVINCLNKSGKSVQDRHSFFSFPAKGADNYETFINVIDPHLKPNARKKKRPYICDAHFEKTCFNESDIKICKDGIVVVVPRTYKRLVKNSIPTLFTKEEHSCLPVRQTTESEKTRRGDISVGEDVVAQSSTETEPHISASSTICKSVHADHEDTNELQPLPATEPQARALLPNFNSRHEDHTYFSSSSYSQNEDCAVPVSVISVVETCSNGSRVPKTNSDNYSTQQLLTDWRNNAPGGLLHYWGLMENNADVLFGYYVDTAVTNLQRIVNIKSDMSTELYSRGRRSTYPIAKKITCFKDFLAILKIVTCLRICNGASCSEGFFEAKPHSSNKRCASCQKHYRNERDKELKRIKRSRMKSVKMQKESKNLRNKYRRSVKKILTLQDQINGLIVECSRSDEKKLQQIIPNARKKNRPYICDAHFEKSYFSESDIKIFKSKKICNKSSKTSQKKRKKP